MKDSAGLLLIDHQPPVLDVVAKRRKTTHPHTLFLGGGDFVADTLTGYLALELGKREQHVQGEPAHRGRRVELLSDGDEGDSSSIKGLDDLSEIEQRARKPVDFVDYHHVDLTCANVGQESL